MVYEEPVYDWFSEDDYILPNVDPWESNMKRYENECKEKAQRNEPKCTPRDVHADFVEKSKVPRSS